MSNLPGDLSAASHPEAGSTLVLDEPSQETATGAKYPPAPESPTSEATDDGQDDQDAESQYNGKSKLRDLSDRQVEQFAGIKREHWW